MTSDIDLPTELKSNPELAMMMLDPPIMFNPIYAYITGSVLAALMLSILVEQENTMPITSDGWITVDEVEIECLTKMTRAEQNNARKVLRDKKLVSERTFDSQLQVLVDFPKITHDIIMLARQRNQLKARKNSQSQSH